MTCQLSNYRPMKYPNQVIPPARKGHTEGYEVKLERHSHTYCVWRSPSHLVANCISTLDAECGVGDRVWCFPKACRVWVLIIPTAQTAEQRALPIPQPTPFALLVVKQHDEAPRCSIKVSESNQLLFQRVGVDVEPLIREPAEILPSGLT